MNKTKTNGIGTPQFMRQLWQRVSKYFRQSERFDESLTSKQTEKIPVWKKFFSVRGKLTMRPLTISILCTAATIMMGAVIIAGCFPVYQVHSSAMSPLLTAGDTVVCMKGHNYGVGDIVAVEYQDMILIKRIVAEGGDRIMIDESGTLYVNDTAVEEPYASVTKSDKVYITQIPQGKWYILNDNRALSGDSRLKEMGSVSDGQIIGRVIFTIWPSDRMKSIN